MSYRAFVIAFLLATSGASVGAASLDLERRIDAHRAVERVLWERRIWPAENPGPKPELESVLPESVLRAKVDEVLRKSSALATLWKRPIGNLELQAEIDRMIRSSQAPDTLEAMLAALDRDPVLIAEVIARPALVDRLIRAWYAMDPRFHEAERWEAEAAFAAATPGNFAQLAPPYRITTWTLAGPESSGTVVLDPSEWKEFTEAHREISEQALGELGPLQERDDAYTATVVLERSEQSVRAAVASWPKTPFDAWWSVERGRHLATLPGSGREEPAIVLPQQPLALLVPSCSDDTWTRTGTGAPYPRWLHSAVWTGSEMIVWGGREWGIYTVDTGARYSPATDTWSTVSTIQAPSPRQEHAAVWTGSKMIVWGGKEWGGQDLYTGGRYDPFTDTWTPTDTSTAPSFNFDPGGRAIWTGSRMIVWRHNSLAGVPVEGSRYDPVADTWSPTTMSGAPLAALDPSGAVWTGSAMVLWPGSRYDPVADTWAPIATAGEPPPRRGHTMVWTGSRVVVWGGYVGSGPGYLNDGALYDPTSNTWTPMSTVAAPVGREGHTAVWVSGRMVVWGGTNGGPLESGSRYDPATNTWAATAFAGAPDARSGHTAIATPNQMIVWGGRGGFKVFHNTGGAYDPISDSWIPTRMDEPSPTARSRHSAVWTGAEMILWGGEDVAGPLEDGASYQPATDSWSRLGVFFGPSARSLHTAVWTGTAMVLWGGDEGSAYANTGGRFDPTSDTWTPTSTTGAPTPRTQHVAVWTGSRMIIWGGLDDTFQTFNTGGSYDPANDTWAPLTTVGAPSRRFSATGVWTGSRMIVWGGEDILNGSYDHGGRYDPATDSWTPTTMTNAPTPRWGHTAVWTGSRMLVWGGYVAGSGGGYLDTGGSYDPASDSWSALSTSGAPSGRVQVPAVWTGNEMIVWGGFGPTGPSNTGGRYRPDTDTWRPTTLAGAPRNRSDHGGVWTGARMVVWGGYGYESAGPGPRNDGASYCSCVSWYPDADGDGFGGAAGGVSVCDGSRPAGLIAVGGDCDDSNSAIHPGVADASCNLVDEDCDGQRDEDYVSQPSVCGLGVCRSFGSLDCVDGQLVNNCVPGIPNASVDDGCNDLDDDCDGGVDDDFVPYQDHWVPIASAPSARTNYTAVISSGTELLVFGGDNGSGVVQTGGIAYDFAADTWRTLPAGPAKRWHHTAVWADSRMIVWGGDDGVATIHNTGSRYDPIANTWAATTTTGAPTARGSHVAVWTGSRMVIWGGRDVSTYFNTGSRYDPAANTWSATTTTGAPAGRWRASAVWTGTEMIVWGGAAAAGTGLNTGGRYNPSSNSWTAVTTTGAPSGRYGHVAVWNGMEMIVWGGTSDGTVYLANGARYDPSTNTWTPMTATDAPSRRAFASAVWTGSELLVWGGTYRTNEDPDTALADGARYHTGNNAWTPMTPHAPPSARARTAAVAQSGEMIVWGGDPNGGALATGARYMPFADCGVGPCTRLGATVCSGGSVSFQCTPGTPQPELCDGDDNDCNAVVDDNVPVPTGVPMMYGTKLVDNTIVLSWSATPNTSYYDMVKGGLAALRASGGDFSNAQCQQNDNPMTQGWDVPVAPPGDGTWYLVRPVNACSGNGSWDTPSPPQQGSRDAELAASPTACP